MDQSKFKHHPLIFKIIKSTSGNLGCIFKIYNIKRSAEHNMILWLKLKFGSFAPGANSFILTLSFSYRNILKRNVWKLMDQAGEFFFGGFYFLLFPFKFCLQIFGFSNFSIALLARELCNFIRQFILVRAKIIHNLNGCSSFLIRLKQLLQIKIHPSILKGLFYLVRIFTDE